jgi:hypothetical protein
MAYGLLQKAFGERYEFFYAANILLHFVNCLLLSKLLVTLGGDVKLAYVAAVLFAVFQAPQEAVMWIAAMNETLLGLFVLTTLILWFKSYRALAAMCFLPALFSKESALIVLLVIPLIEWQRSGKISLFRIAPLLIPATVFTAVFVWTWSGNSMIQNSVYQVGPQALLVLVRTLHLLFRPSFYVLWVVLLAAGSRNMLKSLPKFIVWIAVPLLPYMFLTYAPYIPSRQVYMASMVLACVMGYLIRRFDNVRTQQALVVGFIVYNVAYMWTRNDAQFENRAAPTTHLLSLLRSHSPAPILLEDFPYVVPDVAKDVSRLVPGWTRELIHVNEAREACRHCVVFRWDAKGKTYEDEN